MLRYQLYSDDFNRANESPIQSPWAVPDSGLGGTNPCTIVDQMLGVSVGNQINAAYYSSFTGYTHQYSEADIRVNATNGHYFGIILLCSGSDAYYASYINPAGGGIYTIAYVNNAIQAGLSTPVSVVCSEGLTGCRFRVEVVVVSTNNKMFYVYVDNVLKGIHQDTTASRPTSGKPGVFATGGSTLSGNIQYLDNWAAGYVRAAGYPMVSFRPR